MAMADLTGAVGIASRRRRARAQARLGLRLARLRQLTLRVRRCPGSENDI